jgi:rhodanese-related sulfurtransferase
MARVVTAAEGLAAARGGAVLLDVREHSEVAETAFEGAVVAPMSTWPGPAATLDKSRPVVVMCAAGVRARKAAARLEEAGHREVLVVDKGLVEWQAARLPVIQGALTGVSLERQVRVVAGGLVVLGLVGARLVHPYFLGLSAFVGLGLVYAGVSGKCAMSYFLALAPWNKDKNASCGG